MLSGSVKSAWGLQNTGVCVSQVNNTARRDSKSDPVFVQFLNCMDIS